MLRKGPFLKRTKKDEGITIQQLVIKPSAIHRVARQPSEKAENNDELVGPA
jgi:hypothetical protein